MEEELVQRLLASEGLSGVVGDSVHWGLLPDGASLPAIVIQIAARNRDYTHDGAADLQYPRIQFDSYAEDALTSLQSSRALLTEMEKVHEGDTVMFEDAILVFENEPDPETSEAGAQRFRITQDFLVPFRPKVEGA